MQGGGDLFESGVAGAFADAVDGALDLARAALNAGEGVGDGHAEVVVAVGGEDDVLGAGNAVSRSMRKMAAYSSGVV